MRSYPCGNLATVRSSIVKKEIPILCLHQYKLLYVSFGIRKWKFVTNFEIQPMDMLLKLVHTIEAVAAQETAREVHWVGHGWRPKEERDAISIRSCYSGCLALKGLARLQALVSGHMTIRCMRKELGRKMTHEVGKAPLDSYADIGGLDAQIQEIKEDVKLPLTHPELYEDIGIKPPKGVILYGEPGIGKKLLAKAVANSTSATFLPVVGNELIQKYLGDGPKLVRELFRVADDLSPSIVFIDEIDVGITR
ncbi:hypothetical protein POM88_052404 [Heracleum sosnowskyi]|uniref:ATPase AAA-type core domain-containing protein n=1 Tax=Heracleum sosnowskyi TaxID=360622 RepID=A0AAD8LYV1_9APIA|nr:hypothetical protein POM88_052404 [Heracleum sosnowskyi]